MAVEVTMPKLSQTTEEVYLHNWLVKVGDVVNKGDPLCEVETDKTTMEVESFASGTILLLTGEPENTINVGALIAVIGDPDENIDKYTEQNLKKNVKRDIHSIEGNVSVESSIISGDHSIDKTIPIMKGLVKRDKGQLSLDSFKIKATRLVQNLAIKKGMNLSQIKGTGPDGWITKKDLENNQTTNIDTSASVPAADKSLNLSENQKNLGLHLQASKSQIPHYYLKVSIICDNLIIRRESSMEENGSKISISAMLIFSLAKALKQYPKINSYFQDRLYLKPKINVGFAVSNNDELYVPIVQDAGVKSIEEINRDIKSGIDKVKTNSLESRDILDGTITISNLGKYPVDDFCAIINPPQVAILAFGRIRKEVVVNAEGSMNIRSVCTVTGSFDHRAVNGALGAEFLAAMKKIIEEDL